MANVKELQEAYEQGSPLMTDAAYDVLVGDNEEFTELEDETYVIKHAVFMGTCPKTRNVKEFKLYCKDLLGTTNVVFQPKFDGVSGELIIEHGKITTISSRGNGNFGQDLSDLKDILFNDVVIMPTVRAIYGEFVWRNDNPSQKDRNLVSGYLNKKVHNKEPHLDFIAYKAIDSNGRVMDFMLSQFYTTGIKWSDWAVLTEDLEIPNFDGIYPDIKRDGTIVKNSVDIFALKPEPEAGITTITGVTWKKGKSKFSATAQLEPVTIGAVNVSSVTLPLSYIKDMDLMIGDKVMISRRGDVIPCIEFLVEHTEESRPIINDSKCEYCGGHFHLYGKKLLCENENCVSYLVDYENKVLETMMSKVKGANTKWFMTEAKGNPGMILESIMNNMILGNTVKRSEHFDKGVKYLTDTEDKYKLSLLLFDIDGLSGKRLDKYAAMTTYEPGDKYMEGVAQQLMNNKINEFNKFLVGETK